MTAARCMCGATDCPRCFPNTWNKPEPTQPHYEMALDQVIECVMEHGQWPDKGRAQFDLYDYLLDNLDPSYPMEMYVASLSSNDTALENRRNRERKAVTNMLLKHLAESDFVADLAAEYAEEE